MRFGKVLCITNMKRKIFFLFAVILGSLIGGGIVWVDSYSENDILTDQQKFLESILANSEIVISKENYSCEGNSVKKVGAVIASLLESNRSSKRNSLSYGCYQSVCTMSVSNCKPWQTNECGSRYLKFNIDEEGNINASTFSCFDIP